MLLLLLSSNEPKTQKYFAIVIHSFHSVVYFFLSSRIEFRQGNKFLVVNEIFVSAYSPLVLCVSLCTSLICHFAMLLFVIYKEVKTYVRKWPSSSWSHHIKSSLCAQKERFENLKKKTCRISFASPWALCVNRCIFVPLKSSFFSCIFKELQLKAKIMTKFIRRSLTCLQTERNVSKRKTIYSKMNLHTFSYLWI